VRGVVGDEVLKTETAVRSDVVDRLVGVISTVDIVGKQVAAAKEPGHEISNFSRIAFDERPDIVAKFAVPLAA
jgi:hypothetical protein